MFTDDSSLKLMNQIIADSLSSYSIIGDLPLTKKDYQQLATTISYLYQNDFNKNIIHQYKEATASFIVFCAVYEYDRGTFWKSVEKYTNSLTYNERMELFTTFMYVVKKYHLNTFENESDQGYTYVTPILCHAGIPINALDNYFFAMSNTVNDTFYDDFDVEDYLAYLNNRTEMAVKRYIKLTNRRDAYNFIQNTKQLLQMDTIDNDELIGNGNFNRMVEQIALWKEKPKNRETLQARSNVQITAPKIKIDLDGVGIFCELPRIVVKDCYDSYLIWEITSDEMTSVVKADFYRRSGVFVSEDKIFTLKPSHSYIISLIVDDKQISNWEFKVKENYIAFTENGHFIKTDYLPNNHVVLLLKRNIRIFEKEVLPIMELPPIPYWSEYNVYQVNLANTNIIECTNDLSIRVETEKKPIIEGGIVLFNQENSNAYIELPHIKLPTLTDGEWHIEIKYKSNRQVLNKINATIDFRCEKIYLSSYIDEKSYGEYDIKIWNRNGINGRFKIEYVPFGMIQIDAQSYWPSKNEGYVNNIQTLKISRNVELEIYNAEKLSDTYHGEYRYIRYKINNHDRFLIGEYRYKVNDYNFTASFKKSVYPITWGIIGINNEIVDLSSKVYTFTPVEFSDATNPYLLFHFNIESNVEIETLTIDLIGSDRTTVWSNSYHIVNKNGLRISLNPILFEIQNTNNAIDFHLRATLLDSNKIPITTFLIAKFQDEVVIHDVKYNINDNVIAFTWNEAGACFGRELILLNFLKPWKRSYRFLIEDKVCQISINKELLEDGIYRYVIQKEHDDIFGEEQSDISSLNNFHKGRIVIDGEKNFTSKMEEVLYYLLRTRFMKQKFIQIKLTEIKAQLNQIIVKVPYDMDLLACAYLLHNRFFLEKDDASEIIAIFTSLFELFSSYKTEAIKYILESDFSKEDKKELLHKFYCNNLTTIPNLSDYLFNLLIEIDEDMAGFINLIQGDNHYQGLNWTGILSIDDLREVDIFGDHDNASTFLTEENLGKTMYITEYFQYVTDQLSYKRNVFKTSADFLREFQSKFKVEETVIFGKTRLQTLVEWKENHKGGKDIKEKLSEIVKIPCSEELKKKYKDAFVAIKKRSVDDEVGYYIGLIALYASFIRNRQMKETKRFSRLLNYTIKTCDKLYYRDAIIFELYLSRERG